MFEKLKARLRELRSRATGFEPPAPPEDVVASSLRSGIESLRSGGDERYAGAFLFGKPIRISRGERELFRVLDRAGLVSRLSPSIYLPCVRLFAFDGKLVATDRLSHPGRDQVFSLMFEQVYFVRNMRVRPRESVLEPCVGSGVNSLFAADTAEGVTGTDVNPRALAFARFNAWLNDQPGSIDLREGSLFEPVAGRRFDLVLVNPPFELMPPDEAGAFHSDGGRDGLDVVREVLMGVGDHLTPGGRMEMITWSPGTNAGPELVPVLRDALPGYRISVHILGEDHLDDCIGQYHDRPCYEEWRSGLMELEIDRVHMLFIRAERAGPEGLAVSTPVHEVAACHAVSDAWL